VSKSCPKESAVDVAMFGGPRVIQLLATWAIDVDRVATREIRKTHRESRLALAIDPRTATKVCILEFLVHGEHAFAGEDVSGVNKTIEHLCS
jgi:hypothetical protein